MSTFLDTQGYCIMLNIRERSRTAEGSAPHGADTGKWHRELDRGRTTEDVG